MISDKVMYAELRPMLMDKFIPSDNGERQLDHNEQMQIILEEVKKKQDLLRAKGQFDKFPFGMKIIYCAPRSIPKTMMQREIRDCISLKLNFPDLICGKFLVYLPFV
jgi:adenosine deaminase CECR1